MPVAGLVPARMAIPDREMLASQIRSADMRARMAARGSQSSTTVPLSPPNPITYCVDAALNIVQHGDTARYIRAKGAGRFDTTTYVFTGDTTVRRVSPNERAFGYAMYNTIVGEMHMSLVRKSLALRNAGADAGLPGKALVECK